MSRRLIAGAISQQGAVDNTAFRTLWNMTTTSFTLLTTTFTGGVYNYFVDWGDGSPIQNVTTSTSPTHTYPTTGQYEIKITGSFPRIYIANNATERGKLLKVLNWGNVNFRTFQDAFYGCNNLSELPNGPITGADSVASHAFYSAFRNCTSIVSLSVDLFRYNTLASAFAFDQTFSGCTSLVSLPVDLFRYNTLVDLQGFYRTFFACTSLTSLPNYLFRYNIRATTNGFRETFYDCTKLELNKWIFFAPGEESTRFLNRVSDFRGCFSRTAYTGIQGEAPELWNCDFGTATPATTGCYGGAGNSLSSLSNYNEIPASYK
jgi:hypothetical protein